MSTVRPAVDVCVVTWNTHDVTPDALRRLLDSDQGCDLRVLVRDNGSTDGTAEAIAAQVPEAEIDADDRNLGFGAGMNLLFERTTAPWIFLLNPDAWPQDGAIAELVRCAMRHPRAGMTVPKLENPDGTLQHSTHPFPSPRVAALAALGPRVVGARRADHYLLNGGWMHEREREVDWAIGAAMLVRREALEAAGRFDERFFMYAEDLEWCWRIRKYDYEIWFDPAAVVRHVANVSGEQGFGSKRTATHARNAYRFYRSAHGGVSTFAWWSMTVAGPLGKYVAARARGNAGRARIWREHTLAHWRARRGDA